ncbi:MAG TPA: sigma-70 family RNA polymerase sigma factor, partial [Gemmataceae bacterium]|nr:sigma-70 family RNA polymerase sigma factor [Gemmataceae bacterium]
QHREDKQLQQEDRRARFQEVIVPHLDAAYNLARWLTRNDHDAEDVVQEAYLRAFQFFGGFRGADGRAWLLTIVRNTCYTWLQQNRAREPVAVFDEQLHSPAAAQSGPEALVLSSEDQQLVRQAVEELPVEFREVIVLRDLEGLSYKDIAHIAAIPMGTVMSRLARARQRLQQSLAQRMKKEP